MAWPYQSPRLAQRRVCMVTRYALSCLLAALCCLPALAQQEELQYTKEIGMSLGMNYMTSDLNRKVFHTMQPSVNGVMRFILSPRMAVKTELGYNAIKGNTDKIKEFYPAVIGQVGNDRLSYSMNGSMVDITALYELHFLPYGWLRNYLGHKRITPYLQLGLGMVFSHTNGTRNQEGVKSNAFNVTLPVGLGVKYKVARRLNMALDWTIRFTPSDKLDGLAAPTGIKSSGFHGKDFYSKTMLTLTYDISPKCPTCNKAE